MHCLLETIKESQVPFRIMFNLFDSLVASVLSYGCEIWGFSSAECIERVHRKFCKHILKVKMSTNTYALYTELGRHPLYIERQMRIIKYLLKLATDRNSNCILKSVYNDMKTRTENSRNNLRWTSKVKSLLERNSFAEVWQYPESVNKDMAY